MDTSVITEKEWEDIWKGLFKPDEFETFAERIVQHWPESSKALLEGYSTHPYGYMDILTGKALRLADERGRLSQEQAEQFAVVGFTLLAERGEGKLESIMIFSVCNTLSAVRSHVQPLFMYLVGGIYDHTKDEGRALWKKYRGLYERLEKSAKGLFFSDDNPIIGPFIADYLDEVVDNGMKKLRLSNGLYWQNVSPWASTDVANAFRTAVDSSHLALNEKIMSLLDESREILNSIRSRAQHEETQNLRTSMEEMSVSAKMLISKAEELLSGREHLSFY